jgi:hypothetical protein
MKMGFSQLGLELEEILTIFYGLSAVFYNRHVCIQLFNLRVQIVNIYIHS